MGDNPETIRGWESEMKRATGVVILSYLQKYGMEVKNKRYSILEYITDPCPLYIGIKETNEDLLIFIQDSLDGKDHVMCW